MNTSAKLMFLCGKMAAGKSTLARDLAERRHAILFVQDELLETLFPGEITDVQGFFDRSSRLSSALVVLNIGLELGVISPAMMVRMALVTTFMTTPLADVVGPESWRPNS